MAGRPLTLSAIDGGINRLRLKGGANKDALYDLLNGYVTNAGTVKVRPGTLRNVDLSATTGAGLTKGLVAYQGTKHVFSHQSVPVPAGYTLHVLNHPAVNQLTPAPDPSGGTRTAGTVPILLPLSGNLTDTGTAGTTWTASGGATFTTAVPDPFGGSTSLLNINSPSAQIKGTGGTGFNIIDLSQDWTFEFWYYPTDATAGSGGGGKTLGILDFSDSSARFGYMYANGHQVTMQIMGGTITLTMLATSPGGGLQGPNIWNHIAVVKSGTQLRMYVNGYCDSSTLTGQLVANAFGTGTIANYIIGQAAGSPANGYFSNFRLSYGRGVYCGRTFFPPSSALTSVVNYPYVAASLQHFEANSTPFLDSVIGAETWTATGTAAQSAAQAKFGNQSLAITGAAANINAPLLKDGLFDMMGFVPEYTFDFWMYSPTAAPGSNQVILDFTNDATGTVGLKLLLLTNGKLEAQVNGNTARVDTGSAITANAWHHVAIVYYGTTLMIFLDGTLGQTANHNGTTTRFPTSANIASIGSAYNATSGFSGGFIDEFRVTLGQAVWIANFAPPTAPGAAQVNQLIPIKEIHFASPFLGFLYVVAEFQPDASGLGSVFHYWLQLSGTWAANTDYRIGDVVSPNPPNGLLYTASRKNRPNPGWTPNVQHAVNDVVEPTVPNGFYFTATAVQGTNPTSGNTEPTWPTSDGATITENSQLANDQTITAVTSAPQPKINSPSPTVLRRYANIAGGFKP